MSYVVIVFKKPDGKFYWRFEVNGQEVAISPAGARTRKGAHAHFENLSRLLHPGIDVAHSDVL